MGSAAVKEVSILHLDYDMLLHDYAITTLDYDMLSHAYDIHWAMIYYHMPML